MNRYEDEYLVAPEDPDSERVLLTTMCVVPDHPEVAQVLQVLNGGEAFMVPQHKAIYLSFKALFERHQEIIPTSLKEECERQGTLNTAGGYPGIFEVAGAAEETARPLERAQRIAEIAQRRQIQKLAGRIMRAAGDPAVTMTEILGQMGEIKPAPPIEPLLTVCGAGELLDHEAPAPRWLIPGLIPAAVPVVLASKGGVGKSFLALQICIALATGKAFLNCEAQPPMGAVYFGLEDDKDTFHRRVRSIVGHYKDCDDWTPEDDQRLRENFVAPFINWRARGATAYLPTLAGDLAKILQAMAEHGVRPGAVIIDTLARVSEGDENTVQALRPVLNSLNLILEYQWSPIVLHHVAKGQDGARGDAKKKPLLGDRMSTEWVRGSSAIVDNFRCVVQITLLNGDEAAGAGLDEDKARMGGYAVFGATKLNGGQKADWLFIEQDDHGRWFTPKDGVEMLAKVRGAKAVAALSQQLELLVSIHAQRFNRELDHQALADRFWPNKPTAKDCLKTALYKLRNAGFLQKKGFYVTASGLEKIGLLGKFTRDGDDSE